MSGALAHSTKVTGPIPTDWLLQHFRVCQSVCRPSSGAGHPPVPFSLRANSLVQMMLCSLEWLYGWSEPYLRFSPWKWEKSTIPFLWFMEVRLTMRAGADCLSRSVTGRRQKGSDPFRNSLFNCIHGKLRGLTQQQVGEEKWAKVVGSKCHIQPIFGYLLGKTYKSKGKILPFYWFIYSLLYLAKSVPIMHFTTS